MFLCIIFVISGHFELCTLQLINNLLKIRMFTHLTKCSFIVLHMTAMLIEWSSFSIK